jgi:hypothetical protein
MAYRPWLQSHTERSNLFESLNSGAGVFFDPSPLFGDEKIATLIEPQEGYVAGLKCGTHYREIMDGQN